MSWEPFALCPLDRRPDPPRSLATREGVGDRLRSAAFAEIQARQAFLWAAERYEDAPSGLRRAWRLLASEEDKHLGWLLGRMGELGVGVGERRVSMRLWQSLTRCGTAREFALFMAEAEERGRLAGLSFYKALAASDLRSAEVFGRIAEEEVAHIALAYRYFRREGSTTTISAGAEKATSGSPTGTGTLA